MEKRPYSAPKQQRLVIGGRFTLRAPFWHQTSYCVRISDLRTGKMFKFCTGKTSKAAATRAAVEFAEEQAKDVREIVVMPIADAIKEWLATRRLRPTAHRDYSGMLGKLRGTHVHDVTAASFDKVLSDRPSARTRKKYIVCTRAFFKWAIRKRYVVDDPTVDATPGKLEEQERIALTPEQAATLLQACRTPLRRDVSYSNRKAATGQRAQSKKTLERLWRATLLGLYTGLRLGNVTSLKWSEVSLKERLIRLAGDKTKSGRTIMAPMKKELAAEMATWPKDGPVIGEEVEDLGKSLDSAINRCGEGFPRVTFHSTRHTFASWVIKATKNLALVAELLGHSRKAATVSHRYVHFEPEDLLAAVDSLPWIAETIPESHQGGSEAAGQADGMDTPAGASTATSPGESAARHTPPPL